jgi:hypothetical protein
LRRNLTERATSALTVARARRNAFADQGIVLGDPAWDVLICLIAQPHRRSSMNVRDLVADTGLPEITVRRTLAQLCGTGITYAITAANPVEMLRVGLTPLGETRLLPLLSEAS